MSNTNRAFLVRVAQVVGEGTVCLSKRGDMRWKTRLMYLGTAGVLRSVLPQTLAYMIVKRALAEKMVEFLVFIDRNPIYGLRSVPASYYEKLDSLYWAIKKLNEKGRKPVFTSP